MTLSDSQAESHWSSQEPWKGGDPPSHPCNSQRCMVTQKYHSINAYLGFWLCWVFTAGQAFSLVVVSGVTLELQYVAFSLRWFVLLWSIGSRHTGFGSYSTWVP